MGKILKPKIFVVHPKPDDLIQELNECGYSTETLGRGVYGICSADTDDPKRILKKAKKRINQGSIDAIVLNAIYGDALTKYIREKGIECPIVSLDKDESPFTKSEYLEEYGVKRFREVMSIRRYLNEELSVLRLDPANIDFHPKLDLEKILAYLRRIPLNCQIIPGNKKVKISLYFPELRIISKNDASFSWSYLPKEDSYEIKPAWGNSSSVTFSVSSKNKEKLMYDSLVIEKE